MKIKIDLTNEKHFALNLKSKAAQRFRTLRAATKQVALTAVTKIKTKLED